MANNKFVDRAGNTLLDLTGDTAQQGDVVSGKTFHDRTGAQIIGSYAGIIPTGKLSITATTEVDCSSYATAQVSDANLKAENIKSGVTVLGVTGTHAGSGSLAISTTGNKDVGDYKYAYIDVANIANLDPANIVKDVTILGVTGTAVAGTGTGDAKLNTPSISLGTLTPSQDPLYIYNYYNGNFVTYYDIYKDDVLLTTVSGSTSTVTVNLRTYISTDGTYSIKVVARGTGMQDSDASTAVSYQHKTYVTITNTLVNCSSSNAATSAVKGDSYSATLNAASGYSFVGATIQITMGGVDITSTALNENEISIANVTGDIAIVANFAVITQLATPSNVALSGDSLSWSAVTNATSYGIYANGALKTTTTSTTFDMSTLIFGAEDDYAITVTAIANGYTESNPSVESITYTYVGSTVDTTLANNTWDVIKGVCQTGEASSYWSLGDSKTIAVSGVGDVPHAIVDMTANRYEYTNNSGHYTNVVFQAVPTIGNYVFNPSSNTNANGAYNTWYTSELRTSMNSGTIYGLYDSSFTALLEEVQTYEALDGSTNGNVVQYQADKLFLPTYQEVRNNPTTNYVQPAEKGLNIVEFGYYALNSDVNSQRIKYPFGSSSATQWWLRSPYAGGTSYENVVYGGGSIDYGNARDSLGVAPCFAF